MLTIASFSLRPSAQFNTQSTNETVFRPRLTNVFLPCGFFQENPTFSAQFSSNNNNNNNELLGLGRTCISTCANHSITNCSFYYLSAARRTASGNI